MKKNSRIFLVPGLILLLVLFFSQCVQEKKRSDDPRGGAYAGAGTCVSCHKAITDSYLHTAHNRSTRPAGTATILGSFHPDSNTFYFHEKLKVAMEQRDSGLYQVAYSNDTPRQAQRFDIVVGSGRKAQTFLYWMGDQVYQLPISYSVAAAHWVNSPNYPIRQVRFDRNIPIGCFECHSSYIQRTSIEAVGLQLSDHFNRNRIVYGIDCERCHGPAAQHVDYHREHPDEKAAKHIARMADLTRQERLDQCAVCHSGLRETIRPTFTFRPGKKLSDYLLPDPTPPGTEDIDVHGNQYQLLAASPCFTNSKTLDCSSCHNPHAKERDNLKVFSQRCMSCHNPAGHNFCTMAPKLGAGITSNCIDCHMPALPSKLITLQSQGQPQPTPNLVRTHLIKVYDDATRQFLARHRK